MASDTAPWPLTPPSNVGFVGSTKDSPDTPPVNSGSSCFKVSTGTTPPSYSGKASATVSGPLTPPSNIGFVGSTKDSPDIPPVKSDLSWTSGTPLWLLNSGVYSGKASATVPGPLTPPSNVGFVGSTKDSPDTPPVNSDLSWTSGMPLWLLNSGVYSGKASATVPRPLTPPSNIGLDGSTKNSPDTPPVNSAFSWTSGMPLWLLNSGVYSGKASATVPRPLTPPSNIGLDGSTKNSPDTPPVNSALSWTSGRPLWLLNSGVYSGKASATAPWPLTPPSNVGFVGPTKDSPDTPPVNSGISWIAAWFTGFAGISGLALDARSWPLPLKSDSNKYPT